MKRLLSLSIALFFASFIVMVPAHAGETLSAAVTATLDRLYLTAFDEAIGRHATAQCDGTTYVSTGDIDADWLRDSSAIVRPYIRSSTHFAGCREVARRRRAPSEVHFDRSVC